MLNVEKIRQDFPMLQNKQMQGKPLIYFDNAATTLKPQSVIDAVTSYYSEYGANAHRGDYDLSYFVDQRYQEVREKCAQFINASPREIIYTSGASAGLNLVAFGYGRTHLKAGDIVLTTMAEHASCILPWMRVCQEQNATLDYIDLSKDGRIHLDTFASMMNDKVKVIVLAHVTNVLGYEAPIKEICEIAHRYGAIVVVDGAQSVAHQKIDVKALDCDFFAFSAHKMLGPTGIGVLYGKYQLLNEMEPLYYGGDSNARYYPNGEIVLKDVPERFESGTQPIASIFGLGAAIDYLNQVGMEHIAQYEKELHDYAISKMKQMDHVILYHEEHDSGIITFNVKNIFAQDVATWFNVNGIALRSGQHCAKLLNDLLQCSATLRISLYFYNTKAEVDAFLEVLQQTTMENCLGAFF